MCNASQFDSTSQLNKKMGSDILGESKIGKCKKMWNENENMLINYVMMVCSEI